MRVRRRADREAVLAVVRLAAGLAEQVLALLADAVHHRERARPTPGRGADVVVAADDALERDRRVDRAPCATAASASRGAPRANPSSEVLFDVALEFGREAVDLRLVEADDEDRLAVERRRRLAGQRWMRPALGHAVQRARQRVGVHRRLQRAGEWSPASRGSRQAQREARVLGREQPLQDAESTPDSVAGNGTGILSRCCWSAR